MLTDFSLCENEKCGKANNCKRFMIKESSNPCVIKFYNICSQKNDYFYQMKIDEEIIVKEEVENNG